MTALDKLVQWLKTFPLWEDEKLHIDYLDALPGNSGLYSGGLEEISRREDVLGNVTVRNRLHFLLYRLAPSAEENSRWLLQLQNWVQSQSAAGLAPMFGDAPATEHIRAERGKLQAVPQTGTQKFAVSITAEFEKNY